MSDICQCFNSQTFGFISCDVTDGNFNFKYLEFGKWYRRVTTLWIANFQVLLLWFMFNFLIKDRKLFFILFIAFKKHLGINYKLHFKFYHFFSLFVVVLYYLKKNTKFTYSNGLVWRLLNYFSLYLEKKVESFS